MIDNRKLVMLVSRCPPLWDRNDEKFRDPDFKTTLWNKIGQELNSTGSICKDIFKGLREKYIREREKYGSNWEFLDLLQFLDPHIITRKDSNASYMSLEQAMALKPDPYNLGSEDPEEGPSSESETGSYMGHESYNSMDFSRILIKMVHNAPALWDRSNKDHHDKIVKDQLWKTIARNLKTDISICMLRWKGLREKYIRQKQKYNEGLGKWELLDDMAFLDGVIQYRKRHWHTEDSSNLFSANENSRTPLHPSSDYESSVLTNSYSSLLSNSLPSQCQLPTTNVPRPNIPPDSTLDVTGNNLKRPCNNERGAALVSCKIQKVHGDKELRNPEQIFGELVAAMLYTKPEKEKHTAMMEIMSILTRPS